MLDKQKFEIAFPVEEFTKDELEQGLDAVLGQGNYEILEHKSKPFEEEELGYSVLVDAFIVSFASSVLANALTALIQAAIKNARKPK